MCPHEVVSAWIPNRFFKNRSQDPALPGGMMGDPWVLAALFRGMAEDSWVLAVLFPLDISTLSQFFVASVALVLFCPGASSKIKALDTTGLCVYVRV
jgi:hypothetical protein